MFIIRLPPFSEKDDTNIMHFKIIFQRYLKDVSRECLLSGCRQFRRKMTQILCISKKLYGVMEKNITTIINIIQPSDTLSLQ